MSEEYIGKNGQLVGSAAYFEEINKKCVMVGVFTDCRDHHYSDQLDAFCTRITNSLSEIHEDLKTNARVLPYIPDEPKKELAKFIKSLDDVITSWGKGMTRAYECISLLELRDYATRPKSGADIRRILNVVDEIQGERFFRAGDIVEIIKKAKDYGIKNVSSEEAQIEYIMGLCGEDRDFYDDVFVPLCYRNRIKTFEGKCGKSIYSKEYLIDLKNNIFTSEIPWNCMPKGSDNYADNIKYALDNIFEEIKNDLNFSGAYLSVENINKLNLVSDDFEKLIGRGFSEKLKTEITGVSNIDGLLLDRDFEVLSDDDLAVLKALNNEYLYYEQKQEKAVMDAIGYEIVKIRQKDIYFDQYNPGPYIDRVGYKQDERIIVDTYVMSRGTSWLNGGVNETNDTLLSVISLFDPTRIAEILGYLLFAISLDKEQIAKRVLTEGDINISIRNWYIGVDKEVFYKRDGTHITSNINYWDEEDNKLDKTIINPDVKMESLENLLKEFPVDDLLMNLVDKKLKKY